MSGQDRLAPVYCSEGIQILKVTALTDSGWEQRTVTDPTRIDELQELYTSLGFETKTSGLDPASVGPACTGCAETACSNYVALFTRKSETP